ncbi:MAG TPA: O-antigen ligase family protein [Devosiaceae bacterium]|jgi:hypothetical protein
MALTYTGEGLLANPRGAGTAYIRARAADFLPFGVAVWIISGGVILFEPSFYELLFVPLLGIAVVAGMRFYRSTLSLLLLTIVFFPFALIASFQVRHIPLTQAFIFGIVTTFLLLTAFFAANYVAANPRERLRAINNAYTLIAVLSSFIGVAGYLHLLPHSELFTLYDRAKGMFKDPNVFGPFLVPPALFALQRVLMSKNLRRVVFSGVIYMILLVGVFASFSRAAWGVMAAGSLITFVMVFLLEATARDKVRMLLMGLGGGAFLLLMLVGLINTPAFNKLFEVRASVTQEYDTGSSGRFGRQGYAFDLALQHPWGLGPLEFETLENSEAPHDTYVTVLHHYGWGGGLAYFALIVITLCRAIGGLRYANARLLLIPLIAVYIPLIVEAAIIDIDHWRDYFLIVGLIWGVTTFNVRNVKPPSREVALI